MLSDVHREQKRLELEFYERLGLEMSKAKGRCVCCGQPSESEYVLVAGRYMPIHRRCRDTLAAEIAVSGLELVQQKRTVYRHYDIRVDDTLLKDSTYIYRASCSLFAGILKTIQLPWVSGVNIINAITFTKTYDHLGLTTNLGIDVSLTPVCLFCQKTHALRGGHIPFSAQDSIDLNPTIMTEEELYILRQDALFYHPGCAKEFLNSVTRRLP